MSEVLSIQTMTCMGCQEDFSRPMQRGKKPQWCPACKDGQGHQAHLDEQDRLRAVAAREAGQARALRLTEMMDALRDKERTVITR